MRPTLHNFESDASASFEAPSSPSIQGSHIIAAGAKAGSPTTGGSRRGTSIDYAKYKTKLCRNFIMGVPCPFEEKCVFAHGEHQINTRAMTSSAAASPTTATSNPSTPSIVGHSLKFPSAAPTASPPPPSYNSFMAASNVASPGAMTPEDMSGPSTPPQVGTRFRYEPYSFAGVVYEN